MLSGISKLADRNFIVGFFLPALIGTILASACLPSTWPFDGVRWALGQSDADKALPAVTLFVLAVWIFAVLLQLLNLPVYRVYEGYAPPTSWLRRPLTALQRRQLLRSQAKRDELTADWKAAGDSYPLEQQIKLSQIQASIVNDYPPLAEVVPTSFGNRIRAFEVYPRQMYGADAIPIWFRLQSVIPNDFQQAIAAARSMVDFSLNVAMLCSLLSIALLVLAGVQHSLGAQPWAEIPPVKAALIGAALNACGAYLAYAWATSNVGEWGQFVKAAFDCYLPALAEQLKLPALPSAPARQAAWLSFSQAIDFQIKPGE